MGGASDVTAAITEVGSSTTAGRSSRSAREEHIAPGTVIGRYVVEGVLGSGGMGVVYRARDVGLDRVVALKQLRPEQVRAHGEARLLREARAMAQLSHPNVVPVYGVEHWQGGAVLAMELVQGRSLEEWLRERRDPHAASTLETALRWMRAAGEGLRAAHAAGIVHRDFKPSNVLLGVDERARVVDFGLARPEPLAEPPIGSAPTDDSPPTSDDAASLEPELRTEAGRLMGTVAYMAPEQLMGLPADARSDQYAFCVSLWEVLCGQRPFGGNALTSLDAKLAGPPPWPAELRAPPRIVAAVRRGLSVRPEERWPSMAELLDRLRTDRRPRRRLWLGGVVGLALVASLASGSDEPTAPPCTGAAEHMLGLWDDDRRAVVRRALADAGDVHERDTWPRVEARLDAWAGAWLDAHTEACEATSVRGQASEAELDERMTCLRAARHELRAVVGTLTEPSAADRAVELVAGLPDAARCFEARSRRTLTLPPDAERAERVQALYEALVEVQTLEHAGRVQAARAALEPLVEPARALGWAPLWVDMLIVRASIDEALGEFPAAERDLVEAHALAEAEGLTLLVVKTAEHLTDVVGHRQARYDEAMTWAEKALALVRSDPAVAEREVEVLEAMAVLLHDRGEYAEAAELQRRVLELREQGGEPLALAGSLDALGNIVDRMGRSSEGIELVRRGLELRERELGPDHVTVAYSLNNLASAYLAAGDYALAVPLLERVLRIRERAHGPDSVQLVSVLNNLGSALIEEGDLPAAERHLRRTLALLEASFPEGHPHTGSVLVNLGMLHAVRGRDEEAREHYERALALWERTLGPEHPKLAVVLDNLGNLALREGRPRDALDAHRRTLEIREATLGGGHPKVAESLIGLARASLELGDADSARTHAERAGRIVDAQPGGVSALRGLLELLRGRLLLHEGRAARAVAPLERALASGLPGSDGAEAELALAAALWAEGEDRRRAVVLARRAHASFHAVEDEHGALRAETWLARHAEPAR